MEKVSLLECREYDYAAVRKTLEHTFKNLGGIESYISKGETVLLKVNLLMKKKPEEATTTHPVFVKALAEILADYGAFVVIGDSPGGPFNIKMLKGVYKACGYEEIAEGNRIRLNYNIDSADVTCDSAKILKKLTIVDMMTKVDKVISVSKLKTHGMMMFTGAVKNMFGTIPGIIKAEYHFKMPDVVDFSDMLVDVCVNAAPILSFMDGIVGMEGAGPSAGDPREVGVVLGGTSPYHLDVVATTLINQEPEVVPTIARTIERNITKGDLSDIELSGEDYRKFIVKDFVIPSIRSVSFYSKHLPKSAQKFLDKFLKPKPVFHFDICVGCEECKDCCPPQAIDMKDRKPHVRLDECIRCFCCQELCPKKAVTIHRPWVLSKLRKL